MDQHFGNPVHMAAISMQPPHQQASQQCYSSHGQYQQYYSDYADSCFQPSAFGDAGFPAEQFGYHSTASVPYGSGIESYLDPKYTANPAAFASRLPYLPFHAAAVAAYGMYDYSFEPAFIRKRNERERQRVKCVNEGYARLREHLPEEYAEKRLSKVETLRGAIMYIKQLQTVLGFDPEKEKSKRKSVADTKNTESRRDKSNVVKDRESSSSSADEKEDGDKANSFVAGQDKRESLSSANAGRNSHETLCQLVPDDCSMNSSCEKNEFDTSMKGGGILSQRFGNQGVFSTDDNCSLSPLHYRLGEDNIRNSPMGHESNDHMSSVGGLSSPCSDFRASPNWWTQTNVRPHPAGLDFSDEFHMGKSCVRQDSDMKVDSLNSAFRNARHHPYRGYNPPKSSLENWEDGFLIKTETQTPPPYEQCYNFSNQKENYFSYRQGYSMGPASNNVLRLNSGSRGGQSDGFKTDTSPESSSGLSP